VLELDPANAEVKSLLQRLEAQRAAQTAEGPSAAPGGARTPAGRRGPADLGATLTSADYQPLGIRGLRVDAIAPGGAAERAGLEVGDLVLRVDGDEAESLEKLRKRAARAEGAILDLLRAGKPLKVRLKL
jgi:S1-C subfamily serine protease